MLPWLPAVPYPPLRTDGYWEPVTSTLDWCEENYYATRYAAEIVNTLTNLLFIFLAFRGMYNCWKNGHDRIFFITYFGYLIVGSGSFAFHTSLKYPMQLVDELSMIYTTCLMFWATFEHKRTPLISFSIGAFVTCLALFITGYYHYLQDPTFHQNAYAILTALVLFRSMYVMEVNLRPYFRRTRKAAHVPAANGDAKTDAGSREAKFREQARQDARDEQIVNMMWSMVAFGLTIFLGGFGIWNLDNIYCSKLKVWRREIGLPWGILLEGHGWWHLMTGIGAYFYIQWGIWLRHCLNGRQDEFEMVWPSVFSVPYTVRRSGSKNGTVRKAQS